MTVDALGPGILFKSLYVGDLPSSCDMPFKYLTISFLEYALLNLPLAVFSGLIIPW